MAILIYDEAVAWLEAQDIMGTFLFCPVSRLARRTNSINSRNLIALIAPIALIALIALIVPVAVVYPHHVLRGTE